MAASQYATISDLEDTGLPPVALRNITAETLDAILVAASGKVDSYLRGRFTLPLASPFPPEIVTATVDIAALRVLKRRGFNPDEFDDSWQTAHDAAVSWLRDIAAGRAHLDKLADDTAAPEGVPRIQTTDARGW